MFESDYNKWLEVKRNIDGFNELTEDIQKGIYEAEQKLKDNKEINLIGTKFYLPGNDEEEDYYEFLFRWVGYHKEIKRVAKEMDTTEDRVKDLVDDGGYENMVLTLQDFLPVDINYDIFLRCY